MFHYFYFNDMLPFEALQQHYPNIETASLRDYYFDWQTEVERRLHVFYTAQWIAHQDCQKDGFDLEEHFKLFCRWQKFCEFLSENRPATLIEYRNRQIIFDESGEPLDSEDRNRQFDGLWFNYLVDKFPRNVALHRTLPYQEYLRSPYWKFVRALMLMLYGARCQGDDEMSYDSYWFGWENELEVHHLTYDNRGAERFKDLTLLCQRCHAKMHQEEPA